jgi:hypothetical protein
MNELKLALAFSAYLMITLILLVISTNSAILFGAGAGIIGFFLLLYPAWKQAYGEDKQ